MEGILALTEAGLILTDKRLNVKGSKRISIEDYLKLKRGRLVDSVRPFIEGLRGIELKVNEEGLLSILGEMGIKASLAGEELSKKIMERKVRLMVEAGFVKDEAEAVKLLREVAISLSELKVKELSERPDLHLIETIDALDELDKAINTLGMRLKEWYGLHFPELVKHANKIEDYCRYVLAVGRKEDVDLEALIDKGIPEDRARLLVEEAKGSKGGGIGEGDLRMILRLSEEILNLLELRRSLQEHLEGQMERVAPNLSELAGPTIGARLIAKAGGLDKLAMMPASTIQVLGAEKALFRALRKGGKPPKHGIIFQHQLVRGSPRWQRGKVARSLASKLAIAAKLDFFRGEKVEGLKERLEERIREIREKYPSPKGKRHGR